MHNQVWIHSDRFLTLAEKHKDSKGGYPLAKLIWVDWKNKALIPKVKSCYPYNSASPFSPKPLEGGGP